MSAPPKTYEINGQTGEYLGDGMDATVYRFARNPYITGAAERAVAIKQFNDQETFNDEKKYLELCQHQNVVAVLAAHNESRALVLELGDGELGMSLRANRRDFAMLDMDSVVRPALRDVLRGLQYIHGLNIMHRDIKPHNIICVGNTYKLIDFATARHCEPLFMRSGGTYLYDAPEKLIHMPIDPSSDIWSLAVTAFELATNTMVFDAHNYSHFDYGGQDEELSEVDSDGSSNEDETEGEDTAESCTAESHGLSSTCSSDSEMSDTSEMSEMSEMSDDEYEAKVTYNLLFLQQKMMGQPPQSFTDFAQRYYNSDGRLRNSPHLTEISRDDFIARNFFSADLGEVEVAQNKKILTTEFIDFVFSAFSFDPVARPTAMSLLNYAFMRN